MREARVTDVDLIKELRLRRWARQNYVSAEMRSESWHPVVLEEMDMKDAELQLQFQETVGPASFVPLVPDGVRVLHDGHKLQSEPKLLGRPAVAEQRVHI